MAAVVRRVPNPFLAGGAAAFALQDPEPVPSTPSTPTLGSPKGWTSRGGYASSPHHSQAGWGNRGTAQLWQQPCRHTQPCPQELCRKDCLEAPGCGLGELPNTSAKLSTSPSAVGTLKRPTSLSRHASAAGFPLTAAPRAVPKGHKTPTSYSPMEGGEGPFIDPEDISQLLADVARFADALENLRDVVLRDGECRDAPAPASAGTAQDCPVPRDSPDPRGLLRGPGSPGGPLSPCSRGQRRWAAAGSSQQDNAASCPRTIFIRLLSCLQHGGASRLLGPQPRRAPDPKPAPPGQLAGWGRCPGTGSGGWVAAGECPSLGEAKGTRTISWSLP